MNRKYKFIKSTSVRRYVHEHKRRISGRTLLHLDAFIRRKLDLMVLQHNGGKKTIDVEVAMFCGVKP